MLSLLPLEPRQEQLLRLLNDDARLKDSLAYLCMEAGVKAPTLMDLYRQGQVRLAETDMFTNVRKVVATVIAQAKAGELICPKCKGSEQFAGANCTRCDGTGRIWHEGSLPHQEMVLQATEILKKGSGLQINMQQNTVIGGGSTLFDRFVRATDGAAYGTEGEVVDAEVKSATHDSGRGDHSPDQGAEGEVSAGDEGHRAAAGARGEDG